MAPLTSGKHSGPRSGRASNIIIITRFATGPTDAASGAQQPANWRAWATRRLAAGAQTAAERTPDGRTPGRHTNSKRVSASASRTGPRDERAGRVALQMAISEACRGDSCAPSSSRIFMMFVSNISLALCLLALYWSAQLVSGSGAGGGSGGGASGSGSSERMVRLCIASVDPMKLSSQCVMCNRREFPLTVIDCTGITKVNDLIANPLSVEEATCLIYNCRRQVPDVKPEVYHGSVSNAVNYRGPGPVSNYQHPGISASPQASLIGQGSGSSIHETLTPSGMLGGGYAMQPSLLSHNEQQAQHYVPHASPYMTRLGLGYGANPASSVLAPLASLVPRGLMGGPGLLPTRQQQQPQALPYALVPAAGFPFGSRKYKAALVPLFK